MDATLIQSAAKFCGWYEDIPDVAPDDPAYFSYPNGQGDMYACIADEEGNWHITADGCESMKAELRKRGYDYEINWCGRQGQHTLYVYSWLDDDYTIQAYQDTVKAESEAEALTLALAALEQEDGK